MDLYKAIALDENTELSQLILAKAAKNFYHRTDAERFDLFPFYAILVSSGENKNTDFFDTAELWNARHSPADKPINIGHQQTRIIGHIIDCMAVDQDLKPIPEDTSEGDLPEKLHIVMSGVIYRVWEDSKVQAEVNDIIAQVSKGEIFVSMEALFRDFAYLLTHAGTKQRKIIQRSKDTSSLTKYLRQYKGPGRIYDYTLARVLKNITFSAVGIVKKPANPESIISSDLDLFSNKAQVSESEPVYINSVTKNGDNIMSDEISKATEDAGGFNHDYKVEDHPDFKAVQSENESLKRENAHLHELVAASKSALEEGKDKPKVEVERERDSANPDSNYPNPPGTGKKKLKGPDKSTYAGEAGESTMADNTDTEETMAELRSSIAKLEEKVTALENEKASLAKANDALDATVNAFKQASRHAERAEAMMGVDSGLTRKKALEKVRAMDELSKAGFDAMLEMMKGYASRAPKEITAESVLATAKAEKDAPMGASPESDLQKTIADVKNFLSRNKSAKE